MNRRGFLRFVGLGAAAGVTVAVLPSLPPKQPTATLVREYTRETSSEWVYPGRFGQLTVDYDSISALWEQSLRRELDKVHHYANVMNRNYSGSLTAHRHIPTTFKDWDSRIKAKGSFARWNSRMVDSGLATA